jgi:hypothetical protein
MMEQFGDLYILLTLATHLNLEGTGLGMKSAEKPYSLVKHDMELFL